MRRYYRVTERDGTIKTYKKIGNLCKDYNLKKSNVYYRVGRKDEPYFYEFLKVEGFYFEEDKKKYNSSKTDIDD